MKPLLPLALVACVSVAACERDSTNSPNVIEQTASDVEQEVDGAGQTVEQVGDDVDGAASDAVEAVQD